MYETRLNVTLDNEDAWAFCVRSGAVSWRPAAHVDHGGVPVAMAFGNRLF